MNLSDYIRQLGPEQFAKKFRVTERAALSWQYGARVPRDKVAKRIVDNSPVTWAGIHNQEPTNSLRCPESRASA